MNPVWFLVGSEDLYYLPIHVYGLQARFLLPENAVIDRSSNKACFYNPTLLTPTFVVSLRLPVDQIHLRVLEELREYMLKFLQARNADWRV